LYTVEVDTLPRTASKLFTVEVTVIMIFGQSSRNEIEDISTADKKMCAYLSAYGDKNGEEQILKHKLILKNKKNLAARE
jgi:hypothetical protein